jgi:nicotinate-nucleotide pyrophosphorylase (carboxylating)
MFVPRRVIEEKLRQILSEDIGQSDVTSAAIVASDLTVNGVVVAKETGIVAGIEEIMTLAAMLELKIKAEVAEGEEIKKGQIIMKISGNAQNILSVERTMLNLLSRMSGIATATKRLAEKLKKVNSKAKIAATRKTAPGLLYFDKKAVLAGGGDPHRLHLDDMILVKDNHTAIVGGVEEAVKRAKQNCSFSKKVEVEVVNVADALKAVEAGADIVMLDNFSPKQVTETVEEFKKAGFFGKATLEVSGGITEQNIMEYALTQVDFMSIGMLTHSVKALDMSLEIESFEKKRSV